jgi:SAM-dependent methyltransferase
MTDQAILVTSGRPIGDENNMNSSVYASAPDDLYDFHECVYYHTIDIPGHGLQIGQWDLRGNIHEYLGEVDFFDRRVLEIGTANGFVCFEMERRGAKVVGFDLSEDLTYDAPPHSAEYLQPEIYRDGLRRIRHAWWRTHAALGSKAQVVYGHANRLPIEMGRFDIGVLANVMQHLQDPIGALIGLASRCDEAVVVTETDWFNGINDDLMGMMYFDKDNPYVWYQVKPRLVEAVLVRMGFSDITRTYHEQFHYSDAEHRADEVVSVYPGVQVPHFTIVGRRKKG